jgi:hypothetical protein
VADFSIRAWMREHDVTMPVNDPAVRAELTKLLRRDLTKRLAAYGEQARPNQDRTAPRNADAEESAGSVTA